MRKRLAALALALVLAVGCAAAPESGSVPPPVSPSPAPPPAEPEPAPGEPEEGAEALPEEPPLKTPEDYTQEQLDFFEKYYSPDMDSFWSDARNQKRGEEFFAIVSRWLSLSPEQLEKESLGVVARSRDGTKTVYTLHDDSLDEYIDLWPYCDIWNDRTTGESRFLYATYYDQSVQNETADTLLLYNRTTLRAFSLDTGEELERFVPDFDFGEEVSYYERERAIYGIASDKKAGTVVVAYANWDQRDEESQTFPLRLAVYDREGVLIRDISTWANPRYIYKNFYCYADKMTFPQPGTLCLYNDRDRPYLLRLDYLTDPVPLGEQEILDLWDTLEGVWAIPTRQIYGEKKKEAAFFLREGRPVLRVDGAECPVSAVRRWSEITWEITARGGEGERTFYVDTHHPKDFAILVMEKGDLEYSNCIYTGEAG